MLFFAMGIFQSAASFREMQRPEFALRHFIRFVLAKVAVGSAMEIMTAVFSVCGGIVQASLVRSWAVWAARYRRCLHCRARS